MEIIDWQPYNLHDPKVLNAHFLFNKSHPRNGIVKYYCCKATAEKRSLLEEAQYKYGKQIISIYWLNDFNHNEKLAGIEYPGENSKVQPDKIDRIDNYLEESMDWYMVASNQWKLKKKKTNKRNKKRRSC